MESLVPLFIIQFIHFGITIWQFLSKKSEHTSERLMNLEKAVETLKNTCVQEDAVDVKLEKVYCRINDVDRRLARVEGKMDSIEVSLRQIVSLFTEMGAKK